MNKVYDVIETKKKNYKKNDYKKSAKWKGNKKKIIILEAIFIACIIGIALYMYNGEKTPLGLLMGIGTGVALLGGPIIVVFIWCKQKCYGIIEIAVRGKEKIIFKNKEVRYEFTQKAKAEGYKRIAYIIKLKNINSIEYHKDRDIVKIRGKCREEFYDIRGGDKAYLHQVVNDELRSFKFPMIFNEEVFDTFKELGLEVEMSDFMNSPYMR